MWHNIVKPRFWTRRAKVIDDFFEDATPLKKVEVKRQEWKEHWQVGTPEQVIDDKPCENEALQDLEEALPPMRAEEFKKGQQAVTQQARAGSDGFHPNVPFYLRAEVWGKFGQAWSHVEFKPAHFFLFRRT